VHVRRDERQPRLQHRQRSRHPRRRKHARASSSWTDINWTNAKIAIENRGGAENKKTGPCAAFGAGSTTQFYVAEITDLIGRRRPDHAGRCHLRPPYRQDRRRQ